MRIFSSMLLVCGVLVLNIQYGWPEKYVLDEFCFRRLPKMRRALYGLTSFPHLLRVCSDIETYTRCLITTRETYVSNDYYKVQDFEKHYPSDEELERAGYIFCMLHFPAEVDRYSRIGPDMLAKCKQKNDVERCENQTEPQRAALESAMRNKSILLKTFACNMSYTYWKCMREQYTTCNPDIGPIFDYYIARLGTSCLGYVGEFNVVHFLDTCRDRKRRPARTTTELPDTSAVVATTQPSGTATTIATTPIVITQPPKDGGDARCSRLVEFRPLVLFLVFAEFTLK